MTKANSKIRSCESNRTVLMVDGHGRIRTIRKFHQKLWIGILVAAGCLLFAIAAGYLYIEGRQTHKELQAQIGRLQTRLTETEHEKELLLARAVKAESRVTPGEPAINTPPPQPEPSKVPSTAKNERVAPPSAESVSDTTVPKKTKEMPPPSPPDEAVAPAPEVRVAVEQLKAAYDRPEKSLSTEFVIRNTGNTQAQGRAVVVLSSSGGTGTPRLSLPPVPLSNDRPRGNRGRRFSITRFMRLSLKRKLAEPGLQFDTAEVFVFDMQGKLLQEKTFPIAVTIPDAAPPKPDPPSPPAQPVTPSPAAVEADNSILSLPSPSKQEPQGGQED